MKFKVKKGTPLFKALTAVQKEMTRCNKAAFDVVKRLGYKEMRGKYHVLAGGISSVVIKEGKPQGWRNADTDGRYEYFPSKLKANKELLDEISALPVVEYDAINKPLKFDIWGHGRVHNRVSFHPAITWRPDYVLIGISENYPKYKPVAGMVEIVDSEYIKLSK